MSQQELDPPNPLAHTLLPCSTHSVGAAASNGSVVAVHPHGIVIADMIGFISGYLAIIGAMGVPVGLLFVAATVESIGAGEFVAFYVAVGTIAAGITSLCLNFIRLDFTGYRNQPVLFDRAAKKVHVFTDHGTRWWKLWQWFRTPHSIYSYDWSCIRGEVVSITLVGGIGLPRSEYILNCAVTESPTSNKVLFRFGVGLSSAYEGGGAQLQLWEHIRRYMQENGPALSPGDQLFIDPNKGKFFASLFWGQPLLGPGSGEYWTGKAFNTDIPMTILVILVSAFMLVFLPFTIIAGIIRWLSYTLKAEAKWPRNILDSVGGGPLPANELGLVRGKTWTQRRTEKKLAKQQARLQAR